MTTPTTPTDPSTRLHPLGDAWLVALLAWEHDRRVSGEAPITWRNGVPGTPPLAGAVMYAARLVGTASPMDTTAAELLNAAERCELPADLRPHLRAGVAAFSRWACPRHLLAGDPTAPHTSRPAAEGN